MPPESKLGDEYCPKKQDIWALGVTIYCFCFNRLPDFHEDRANLPSDCDSTLRELLEKLLDPNPSLRPSASEVLLDEYF